MNYKLIAATALVFASCTKKTESTTLVKDPAEIIKPAPPADNTFTIVPGVSIGQIVLGNNAETLSVLGKPDFSDSAMGKAWLIWYKNKAAATPKETAWMIYTNYKNPEMKEKVISEIRVNSGEFKTEGGLGAGTSFEEIRKEFPQLKEFAKYKNQQTNRDIFIYDAEGSGIAFEFISYEGDYAKCVAVVVYPKDKKLNTDYIMDLPERSLPGGE